MPDLSSLSNLQLLDLRENHLDSQLPPLPKGLTNIFVSNNSFSGSIPEQLVELNELQYLDLSNNHLSGIMPPQLFSLPNIMVRFRSISKCGDALSLVDLSDNRLIGALPACLDIDSDKRVVKIHGNCFSFDTRNQHPESYCKDTEKDKGLSSGKKIAIFAAVIGGIVIVVVLLLVVGLLIFCKRHHAERTVIRHVTPKIVQDDPPLGISAELLANARIISQAAKLGTQSAPAYKVFSMEELVEATDNFDQLAFLGESSIGKVYKGMLENGTYVAVRSLALCRKYSIQNLKLRLDLLSKLRHPHLVGLLGHCIDGGRQDDSTVNRLFLVYEFVPSGNFQCSSFSLNQLFASADTSPEKGLKWSDRLGVLIGVAKAVHFLHTGVIPPCYNNRLRTNNILLDEHRIAKLSDYGMSIIREETEKAEAKGDGSRSWHSTKSEDDVYNFGFILLESLVGPIVTGKGEAFLLNEMTSFGSQDGMRKIVDPIVLTTSSQESLSIVISLTNKCILPESSSRPSFEDVLWNLQYAAQVQATADSDQKSDTTSQSELQLR
ncbi:Leucine-rich repeat protein kinase family protein [Forsythia ovata]|uniref:Leucine-rich repeat protein kinase family protein n=1 Tax=Forsythia ovata TaxID=205694 RepID=A0ABD1UDW4_9LAMI